MNAVLDHAARGGAVMGICNGFQVLTETGMVPGVLIRNAELKFACRNVELQVCETLASPFTSELATNKNLTLPIAHNEGNYFAEPDELDQLKGKDKLHSDTPIAAQWGQQIRMEQPVILLVSSPEMDG